ncbi:MAG TPA: cellulase family glycosylhydrolase [Nevskiaceae bacterium]|nr:cellulase family glycosylhydrolase [Nevskiaceae bacterium]
MLLLLAALGGVAAGAHFLRTPPSIGVPVPARPAAAADAWSTLPAGVRDRFARGVSLSFWFTHLDSRDMAQAAPDAADFALIGRLGLRHVRVMFDPAWLSGGEPFGAPIEAHLQQLLAATRQANDAGLMMVLAMQPMDALKPDLAANPATLAKAASAWRAVAEAFKTVPADQVVFEVLNEPTTEDAARSRAMQVTLVEAVRAVSPDRVVVVAGAHFSDIDDLVLLQPLAMPGVVYAFHFYEPHNFTHQGATWGWPMWKQFHDLPYPSSPAGVQPILSTTSPEALEHVQWYGRQSWNREKLATIVGKAVTWSRTHGVPIWCSEFGVLRDVTPPQSRRAWLTDVREIFESNGIAWTHFDWWNHFGLVTGPRGARQVDEVAVTSLGLQSP